MYFGSVERVQPLVVEQVPGQLVPGVQVPMHVPPPLQLLEVVVVTGAAVALRSQLPEVLQVPTQVVPGSQLPLQVPLPLQPLVVVVVTDAAVVLRLQLLLVEQVPAQVSPGLQVPLQVPLPLQLLSVVVVKDALKSVTFVTESMSLASTRPDTACPEPSTTLLSGTRSLPATQAG